MSSKSSPPAKLDMTLKPPTVTSTMSSSRRPSIPTSSSGGMGRRDASEAASGLTAACVNASCAHPAVEPFADFVTRSLAVHQDSLLGRIVEQAAMLYLFRSDPDALRAMMEFWFYFRNLCEYQELPPPLAGSPSSAIKPQTGSASAAEMPAVPVAGSDDDDDVAAAAAAPDGGGKDDDDHHHRGDGTTKKSATRPAPLKEIPAVEDHKQQEQQQQQRSQPRPGHEPSKPVHVQEEKLHARTRSMPPTLEDRFEDFLSTQMGVLQNCIEAYFSTDWHRQRDVMETNRQHREFMERREWITFLVDGYKQFRIGANAGRRDEVNRVLTSLWENRNQSPGVVETPTLVKQDERAWYELGLERIDRSQFLAETAEGKKRPYAILAIFHAGFSVPSTIVVKNSIAPLVPVLAKYDPPVRVRVINSTVEVDLVVQAGVREFPTIMFLPANTTSANPTPPAAAADTSAPSSPNTAASGGFEATSSMVAINSGSATPPRTASRPTSAGSSISASSPLSSLSGSLPTQPAAVPEWRLFPSEGVMTHTVLTQWVQSNATSLVPQRKIKKFVTKLVKLDQRLRFAPFRKLHSAANVVRRLCSTTTKIGGTCSILSDESDASPASVGAPKPEMSEQQQQQGGEEAEPAFVPPAEPRFIFLGGGAASGKSTAVMALRKSEWWEKNASSIVVVDADEFKRKDPMFCSGPSDLHEKSTKAAEFLLVSAVNEGRHVIFDSTMMWAPFIEQTIDMIRNSHKRIYGHGPGWRGNDQPEVYWECREERPAEEQQQRAAYRISIYGIFADPAISVPRCLVRELTSGRTLLVSVLLKSLKMFAQNFEHYCELADDVVLFDNNFFVDLQKGELPPIAAKKDARGEEMQVLRADSWKTFLNHKHINGNANSLDTLFEN